jgi:hypothetical protein
MGDMFHRFDEMVRKFARDWLTNKKVIPVHTEKVRLHVPLLYPREFDFMTTLYGTAPSRTIGVTVKFTEDIDQQELVIEWVEFHKREYMRIQTVLSPAEKQRLFSETRKSKDLILCRISLDPIADVMGDELEFKLKSEEHDSEPVLLRFKWSR